MSLRVRAAGPQHGAHRQSDKQQRAQQSKQHANSRKQKRLRTRRAAVAGVDDERRLLADGIGGQHCGFGQVERRRRLRLEHGLDGALARGAVGVRRLGQQQRVVGWLGAEALAAQAGRE